jgi:formimidoylglutamate deiminase
MNQLFARQALLPQGWRANVLLTWDQAGELLTVHPDESPPDGVENAALVLPGMINLHSHSFQRALGGLAETANAGPDSFWQWRDLMYRFAQHLTPDHIEAIAAQLFADCLRHGYTALCEFHYLHRAADGSAYSRPAETAERIAAAARTAGIGLTLLPVLYRHAGFGAQLLGPEQGRFRSSADDVLRMLDALEPLRDGQLEVGFAPHSLRAATVAEIAEVLAVLPSGRPVHIHIAEQQAEVDRCLAWCGQRPLRYLLDHVSVDARWCLVHATHLDCAELADLAASGAVAGLCPSTEANLADGLFPLAPFIAAGGRFGIGSDSHVSTSPVEELRWLEYGQRLRHQRRNIAASAAQPRVGEFLWQSALQGGAQASGRPIGALASGKRADLIVLDGEHPNLNGILAHDVLGCLLFAGNDNLVRHVLVGGRWVVRDRLHCAQPVIAQRYKQAVAQLRELCA